MSYIESNWENCYDDGWKGLLYEDKESGESAFSHPAKMARGLVFKIIEYALKNGWIQPGQTVLDPFGGVGTTALPALMAGLNYIGVELEPRFVELGQKNIELWQSKFAGMPKWVGTAQLLQGDSRQLSSVIAGAGIVVGSPPYANIFEGQTDKQTRAEREAKAGKRLGGGQINHARDYGCSPGQLGAMVVGSPPFAGNTGGRGEASRNGIDTALFDRHSGGMKRGTGDNPANLDHLPQGTPPMIVGSPPYAQVRPESNGGGVDLKKQWETYRASGGGQSLEAFVKTQQKHSQGYGSGSGQLGAMVVGSPPFAGSVGSDDPAKRGGILVSDPKRAGDVNLTGSYGDAPGQLGAMVVGSPPFENSLDRGTVDKQMRTEYARKNGIDSAARVSPIDMERIGGRNQPDYGSTPNQLGNATGETFWTAAAVILSECAAILPPGAYAIWVTKRYVKNGAIVDFTGQWAALCETSGFEVVERIRAWLVKNQGLAQAGLDGEMVSKEVGRKSFFRRLHERKNPHLSIDWEDVIVTRRRPDAQLALFTEAA